MCGIAGIFAYGYGASAVEPGQLVAMRDAMTHRGPDDAGTWINAKGTTGLAHRRLSIIDLSPDGRQPMANEDDTVVITFNGEIYNYREKRPALVRAGHRFRSQSDTEVIVHLYEELGPDCVHELDGMFAFAIWDEKAGRMLLARDRLGVKPIYYCQRRGFLVFASEIKALLKHPAVAAELDEEAVYHYLTFKATPSPRTMFAGISKLAAGHHLTCDGHGNMRLARYWDPADAPAPAGRINIDSAIENVKMLFDSAVKKRMIADVPVGVFLSGGLDSSAVVGVAAGCTDRPLKTFSIGLSDLEGYNELDYAREVSRRYGTDHHEILYGRKDIEDYLPELVHCQDEPLADPVCIPLFHLARLARQSGIVVVQVGEGSDEQFLGYDSRIEFLQSFDRKWRRLMAVPRPALQLGSAVAGLMARATPRGRRWSRIFDQALGRSELFFGSVAFGENGEKSRLLADGLENRHYDSGAVVKELMGPLLANRPKAEMAARVSYLDLKLRLPELLLMRVDKVTMSMGVEAREPFMDYRLVEYLMSVPRKIKLNGWDPKHILKRAVAGIVPESILRRPKQAFAAPIDVWLRSGMGNFARSVISGSRLKETGLLRFDAIENLLEEHIAGRRDWGVQAWTMMNLCAWYDRWIAGDAR
jgi:asparagine synthase (glutamine-hydrolysing)